VAVLTGDFVHKGFKYIHSVARVLGRMKPSTAFTRYWVNHDFSVRNWACRHCPARGATLSLRRTRMPWSPGVGHRLVQVA